MPEAGTEAPHRVTGIAAREHGGREDPDSKPILRPIASQWNRLASGPNVPDEEGGKDEPFALRGPVELTLHVLHATRLTR